MIVPAWEDGDSDVEYRRYLKGEYIRLKQKRESHSERAELDEVRLRLFLSLLDKPVVKAHPPDDTVGDEAKPH